MQRRQPLPRLWLMTDERQGEGLWTALRKLPRGSGVVFRNYETPNPERLALLRAVKRMARGRRLKLIVGRPELGVTADGVHGRKRVHQSVGIRTAPVHDVREMRAAECAGADLLFVSPACQTRSHPAARPLGPVRFMLLARQARRPVIALGGMNAQRARRLGDSIYGWAGIDAWS